MKFEAVIIVITSGIAACMRRGPHHPHGHGVEQAHHHYVPRGTERLTRETKLLHDAKHIEEDVQELTPESLANMTPEELEFYYFSAHDFDRNSMLDGLEMLKAIYHTMEHEPHSNEESPIEPEANSFATFMAIVDRTLETDDMDGDGYVSYAEYRAARLGGASGRAARAGAAGGV